MSRSSVVSYNYLLRFFVFLNFDQLRRLYQMEVCKYVSM